MVSSTVCDSVTFTSNKLMAEFPVVVAPRLLRVAVSAPAPLAGAAIDLGAQAIPARPPLPGEQFQVRAGDQRLDPLAGLIRLL